MSKPTTVALDQLQSAVQSGVDLALRELSERESRETSAGAIVTDPTTTMGYFPTEPNF